MLHFLCIPLLMAFPDAPEGAAGVMARMSANFEKATDARRLYVYEQKVRSSLVRADGKVSRREKRSYIVTPAPEGNEKKLTSFEGEYRKGNKMYLYDKPGFQYKGMDLDGSFISELTTDLVDKKDSRDGIPHSLFPLRSADLKFYQFTWKGETMLKGRRTFVIGFEPATREKCVVIGGDDECDGRPWKGTAWIDAEELQPARLQTDLAFTMPWGVRVLLGTDLKQTGFSLAYERVAENVWFPVSYGAEFRLNVLFGYKRTITLSLASSGFRKADVSSEIQYESPAAQIEERH